jgi:hypothetical protein
MAWIKTIPYDEADEKLKQILDETRQSYPKEYAAGNPPSIPIDESIGYVILNFITVFSAVSTCVKCKQCGNDVQFQRASERGLGFKIAVQQS